jgi:stearoyl-CoA desaturase (Delta-9 desaturase)
VAGLGGHALDVGAAPITRVERVVNLLGVGIPAAGLVLAVALLWGRFVGPTALGVTAAMYLLSGVGITVGFHRLFAHRSFQAAPALRVALAILGSMGLEGPVIKWVSNHRMHHAFADEPGDPHSPHTGPSHGPLGALRGLWHAHLGWMLGASHRAAPQRYARDLLADPAVRFVDRTFAVWVAAGAVLPFAAGLAVSGSLRGGLLALLWGGPVRVFLLHHVTFSINSLCHFLGRRRFPTHDESRNLFWLAPFSLGEAWHNNHHAFPTSAFHGLRPRELDPGGWVIRGLERMGLAWNVRRVSGAQQAAKSPPAGSPGPGRLEPVNPVHERPPVGAGARLTEYWGSHVRREPRDLA